MAIISGLFWISLISFSAYVYSFLSGLDSSNFLISVVLIVGGSFLLYISYAVGKVNRIISDPKNCKSYKGGLLFWTVLATLLTPVVMNCLSIFLKRSHSEVEYGNIYQLRFWGMLLVPPTIFSLYALTRWLIFRFRRFRERLGVGIIERGTL